MTKKVMDFPLPYLNLTRRRNKKCGTYRNVNGFADDDRTIGTASPAATKTPTITFQAALFQRAGIGARLRPISLIGRQARKKRDPMHAIQDFLCRDKKWVQCNPLVTPNVIRPFRSQQKKCLVIMFGCQFSMDQQLKDCTQGLSPERA